MIVYGLDNEYKASQEKTEEEEEESPSPGWFVFEDGPNS